MKGTLTLQLQIRYQLLLLLFRVRSSAMSRLPQWRLHSVISVVDVVCDEQDATTTAAYGTVR